MPKQRDCNYCKKLTTPATQPEGVIYIRIRDDDGFWKTKSACVACFVKRHIEFIPWDKIEDLETFGKSRVEVVVPKGRVPQTNDDDGSTKIATIQHQQEPAGVAVIPAAAAVKKPTPPKTPTTPAPSSGTIKEIRACTVCYEDFPVFAGVRGKPPNKCPAHRAGALAVNGN